MSDSFDPDKAFAAAEPFDPDKAFGRALPAQEKKGASGLSALAAPLQALNTATFGASDYASMLPNYLWGKATGDRRSYSQMVDDVRKARDSAFTDDLGETGGMYAKAATDAVGTVLPAFLTGGASLAARGVGAVGKTAGTIADAAVGQQVGGNLLEKLGAQATLGGVQGALNAAPGDELKGGIMGAVGGGVAGVASPMMEALRPYLAKKFAGSRVTPEEFQKIAGKPFSIGNAPEIELAGKNDFPKSIVGMIRGEQEKLEKYAKNQSDAAYEILQKTDKPIPVDDVVSVLEQVRDNAPAGQSENRDAFISAVNKRIDYVKRQAKGAAPAMPSSLVDEYGNALPALPGKSGTITPAEMKDLLVGLQKDATPIYEQITAGKKVEGAGEGLTQSGAALRQYLATKVSPQYGEIIQPAARAMEATGPLRSIGNPGLKSAVQSIAAGRNLRESLMDAHPTSQLGENFIEMLDKEAGSDIGRKLENRTLLNQLTGRDKSVGTFGSGAYQEGQAAGNMAADAVKGGMQLVGHAAPGLDWLGKAAGLYESLKARSGGGIALKLLQDQKAMQTFLQKNPKYAAMLQSSIAKGGAALPAALGTILNQDPAARESAIQSFEVSP